MAQENLFEGIFRSLKKNLNKAMLIIVAVIVVTTTLNCCFPTIYESHSLLRVLSTEGGSEKSLASSMNGILSQRAILSEALKSCGLEISGKPAHEVFSIEDAGPGLVKLVVRNENPQLLKGMGDSLIKTLSDKFLGYSSEADVFEIEALEKKRDLLLGKTKSAKLELAQLRNSPQDLTSTRPELQNMEEEIAAVEQRIQDLRQKLQTIPKILVVASKETTKSYSETFSALTEARYNLADMLRTYREKHPKVVTLNTIISQLETKLKAVSRKKDREEPNQKYEIIQKDIEISEARLADLKVKFLAAQRNIEQTVNRFGEEIEAVEKRIQAYDGMSCEILAKLEELKLKQSASLGKIQVLRKDREPPLPMGLSFFQRELVALFCGALLSVFLLYSPSPLKAELVGISASNMMAGGGFGCDAEPVQAILQVPALSYARLALPQPDPDLDDVVPTKYDERLIVLNEPDSPKLEPFKALRSNLQILLSETGTRIIIICSSRSGMGRTTLGANLAVLLAQAGYSIALIDANFRKPDLHRLFNIENHRGLSNSLCGKSYANFIQPTSIKNLSLLSTGPIPPNPSELLGSVSMIEFLDDLKRHAELVLIDTPALLDYPDAGILASHAGGVVFLHRDGEPESDIVASRDFLKKIRAKVLGYVHT